MRQIITDFLHTLDRDEEEAEEDERLKRHREEQRFFLSWNPMQFRPRETDRVYLIRNGYLS